MKEKQKSLQAKGAVVYRKSLSVRMRGATRLQVYRPPMTHWDAILTQYEVQPTSMVSFPSVAAGDPQPVINMATYMQAKAKTKWKNE